MNLREKKIIQNIMTNHSQAGRMAQKMSKSKTKEGGYADGFMEAVSSIKKELDGEFKIYPKPKKKKEK